MYIMVDFISMGLLDMLGSRTDNYKMKNSCPHWDLNQGSFASEANGSVLVKGCTISWDIEHLNIDRVLLEFSIYITVPRGRCSKMIFIVFLSYNICIVLLFALLRRLLTVKS